MRFWTAAAAAGPPMPIAREVRRNVTRGWRSRGRRLRGMLEVLCFNQFEAKSAEMTDAVKSLAIVLAA
jgi:hypothetical protein